MSSLPVFNFYVQPSLYKADDGDAPYNIMAGSCREYGAYVNITLDGCILEDDPLLTESDAEGAIVTPCKYLHYFNDGDHKRGRYTNERLTGHVTMEDDPTDAKINCMQLGLLFGQRCRTRKNKDDSIVCEDHKCEDFEGTEEDNAVSFFGGRRCKWWDGCMQGPLISEPEDPPVWQCITRN